MSSSIRLVLDSAGVISLDVHANKMTVTPFGRGSISLINGPTSKLSIQTLNAKIQTETSLLKVTLTPRANPIITLTPGGGGGGGGGAGNFSIVGTTPLDTEGENDDGVFVVATQKIMRKEGGTWVTRGQVAKTVSNSQVTFQTPSAGNGTAELATP